MPTRTCGRSSGPAHPAGQRADGQGRGDVRGEERDQDQRREHPDAAQEAAGLGPRRLVAVADRRHRHRRPPQPVGDALERATAEVLRVGAPLAQPDDGADRHQHQHQQADQLEEGPGQEVAGDGQPVRAARCGRHGDAEAGAVVGVAEVDQPLAFGRGGGGDDGGELVRLDRRQQVGRRHLLEPVRQPEVAGDMAPQPHGDAVPAAAGVLHGERRRLDDADQMRARDRPPADRRRERG